MSVQSRVLQPLPAAVERAGALGAGVPGARAAAQAAAAAARIQVCPRPRFPYRLAEVRLCFFMFLFLLSPIVLLPATYTPSLSFSMLSYYLSISVCYPRKARFRRIIDYSSFLFLNGFFFNLLILQASSNEPMVI